MRAERARTGRDYYETNTVPFTDDDVGKTVVDSGGEAVGIVSAVGDGTAYVDPDPGATDQLEAKLGREDRDEESYSSVWNRWHTSGGLDPPARAERRPNATIPAAGIGRRDGHRRSGPARVQPVGPTRIGRTIPSPRVTGTGNG